MYPGIGPDGVYRLHSGVKTTEDWKRPSPEVLIEQLTEGGCKVTDGLYQANVLRAKRRVSNALLKKAVEALENRSAHPFVVRPDLSYSEDSIVLHHEWPRHWAEIEQGD